MGILCSCEKVQPVTRPRVEDVFHLHSGRRHDNVISADLMVEYEPEVTERMKGFWRKYLSV